MTDIKGFENLYAVTEEGMIWSYRQKKFMKIANGNNGYKQIYLTDKNGKKSNWYIHRLVAMTYLDNPDNLPEVNHKDENKANNAVSNLEWCTRKYNLDYSDVYRRAKVYCLELDQTFNSVKEAAEFTGANKESISGCINKRYKTAGGYHWRYAE